MALNASGTISLGGTTVGQSINIERGKSALSAISLGDTEIRSLGGVASGAISFSDFYSKAAPVGQVPLGNAPLSGTWTVPTGVYRIGVVCIGAGAGGGLVIGSTTSGGGGGALSYTNSIAVTPGESLNWVAPAGGARASNPTGVSSLSRGTTVLVSADYGRSAGGGGSNVNCIGDVKYSGGSGGATTSGSPGGGGAAGYSGNGGYGGSGNAAGGAGTGGGGGGGGGSSWAGAGGGGGGVGPVGEGTSGAGGTAGGAGSGGGGGGGSQGTNGGAGSLVGSGQGGGYGGGGGVLTLIGAGGYGIVRIMWGGNRYYPATNTGIL